MRNIGIAAGTHLSGMRFLAEGKGGGDLFHLLALEVGVELRAKAREIPIDVACGFPGCGLARRACSALSPGRLGAGRAGGCECAGMRHTSPEFLTTDCG